MSVRIVKLWKRDGLVEAALLAATMSLRRRPVRPDDGLVKVPAGPRRELERLIESAANVLSVAERRGRQIGSSNPCVALIPEKPSDVAWLEGAVGFRLEPGGLPDIDYKIDLSLFETLGDRMDGVALVAEALAHGYSTGKLVEYVRFFECAFGLHRRKLVDALASFLRGSRLGYSRREVEEWIVRLRNPAVHGTMPRVVFEADVRPVISRVEQAAYDVLFNKVLWGSASVNRRSLLSPPTGLSRKGVFVKKAATAALKYQLLDDFAVYPLDLGLPRIQVPATWWSPAAKSRVQQMSGVLEIAE
jgi:hypothetical protein